MARLREGFDPGQLRTDSRGAGTIERGRHGRPRLRQKASVAPTRQLTLAAKDRRSFP